MHPGETIATGAPTVCPNCRASVLPLVVLCSAAGHYIGTRCNCGPSYSRESGYYPSQAAAETALAERSFGRGGVIARDIPLYWADRPTDRDTTVVPPSPELRAYITTLANRADRIRAVEDIDPPTLSYTEVKAAATSQPWLLKAIERKPRFIAQLLGTPPAEATGVGQTGPPSRHTRRFNVTVLHKTGPRRFRCYLPGDPLTRVFDLTVRATSAEEAAEFVFGITNSSADELHCDPRYADDVAAYRGAFARSVSVGDVLLIRRRWRWRRTAWACEPSGFTALRRPPSFTDGR